MVLPVRLLVEESAAFEAEALVEAGIEVAVEAFNVDPDVVQELRRGPRVGGRRVDGLRAAVADQRSRTASLAVGGEVVLGRVAARLLERIEDEDLRLFAFEALPVAGGGQTADARADDDQVVVLASVHRLRRRLPERAVAKAMRDLERPVGEAAEACDLLGERDGARAGRLPVAPAQITGLEQAAERQRPGADRNTVQEVSARDRPVHS